MTQKRKAEHEIQGYINANKHAKLQRYNLEIYDADYTYKGKCNGLKETKQWFLTVEHPEFPIMSNVPTVSKLLLTSASNINPWIPPLHYWINLPVSIIAKIDEFLSWNWYQRSVYSLAPVDRKIVLEHLILAGHLNKWWSIQQLIGEQFLYLYAIRHVSKHGDVKHTFNRPFANDHYKWLMSFQTSFYQMVLDSIICGLMGQRNDPFRPVIIYYNHSGKPMHVRFDQFNMREWILKTQTYKDVFRKFDHGVRILLEQISEMAARNHSSYHDQVVKQYDKWIRTSQSVFTNMNEMY